MDKFFGTMWKGFVNGYTGLESWVSGLFRFSGHALPIEMIVAQADPRFIPKIPMSSEGIDVKTQLEISHHGFKHSKLVTAQTHPELFEHWNFLCRRAGFTRPLQLIICESDIPNAFAISDSEMGITTGLLQHLTYREAIAVLSHELGHARNYEDHRGLHAATSGGFSLAGAVLPWFGGTAHSNGWLESRNRLIGSLVGANIGGLVGMKIVGYGAELRADLEGAVISHDPEALISALTKLENEAPNAEVSGWRRMLSKITRVHPPTSERIRFLEEIKRELDSGVPAVTAPQQPAISAPQSRISGGQTTVERVSTNSPETAISGA